MSEGSKPGGYPAYAPPAPSGSGLKIPILFGIVIALIAANVYLFIQLNNTRADMDKMRDTLSDQILKVREGESISAQTSRRTIESLRDQLEAQRRQLSMATGQARDEAARRVAETEKRLQAAQAAQAKIFESKVNDVKQETDTANTKIAEVGTEVTGVKTDVESTKSELEKTIADLKRVNGDLTGQASLIATNGKELDALKSLGERNYFEFTVGKTKAPQKVGDILIQLKKADPKHHRFSIDIVADDKTQERRDKTINEPVQFYTSHAHQPYEIVVNDVKKNEIVGYLSTPKVQNGRNGG